MIFHSHFPPHRQTAGLIALCITSALLAGCSLTSKSSEKAETLTNSEKKSMQRRQEDDWSFVGKEGRSRRPAEKSNDWIDGLIKDQKTISIEKNLGIE